MVLRISDAKPHAGRNPWRLCTSGTGQGPAKRQDFAESLPAGGSALLLKYHGHCSASHSGWDLCGGDGFFLSGSWYTDL